MKLNRIFIALLAAAALAVTASAQTPPLPSGKRAAQPAANPQALSALQTDLTNAIKSMKAALPIYDGARERSIGAAHKALMIVDKAISGAKTPAARPKPKVKDTVPSVKAKKTYSAQQISQSQTNMQAGLTALNQATTDFQTAFGSQKRPNLSKDIQTAVSEATKAINLHANGQP